MAGAVQEKAGFDDIEVIYAPASEEAIACLECRQAA